MIRRRLALLLAIVLVLPGAQPAAEASRSPAVTAVAVTQAAPLVRETSAPAAPKASAPPATLIAEDPFGPSDAALLAKLSSERQAAGQAAANQVLFIAKPTPAPTPAPTLAPTNYVGSNHLWVPGLGISANWGYYGCEPGAESGLPNGLFIWTCAQAGNTYFVAHSTSTFAPLRIAFRNGQMQPGMLAVTADSNGQIYHWKLAWVQKVAKTTANADPSTSYGTPPDGGPALTFMTCYETYNLGEYYIIARWVPAA